ncbi:MAG: phenylphosphate carboxylase subunit delta, partial [Methylococcales bacterium]|nr:phenylphosphate carboxylase subunit delta [Methylococcales bacterium]
MKSIDEFNKKARALKLLILDVDGVLTDGRL